MPMMPSSRPTCSAKRGYRTADVTGRPAGPGHPDQHPQYPPVRPGSSHRLPAGLPEKCTYKESGERFCIVTALDRAQQGDVETGLVFCGTNAWKADKITTVQAIFDELFGAEQTLQEAA